MSPDNAHSTPRGDCLAYDLCPFCLMRAHPQMFSILTRNIDILIFSYHTTAQEFNTLIIGRPRRHRVSQMTRNDGTVTGYNNLRTATIRIIRNDIVNVFSFVLCTCRLWWYQATLKCPEDSITAEWDTVEIVCVVVILQGKLFI